MRLRLLVPPCTTSTSSCRHCQMYTRGASHSQTPTRNIEVVQALLNGMGLPLVVLVSGRPASGKTTLARHIAHRLKAPVISRDPITEALAETFQRRSHEVSNPSFAVFWRLIHE